MFIEVTRVYRNHDYEHKMLLNVTTIMKVEPCDKEEYNAPTRIVLDRTDENDNNFVFYVRETYKQVAIRVLLCYKKDITGKRKNGS